MRRQRKVEELTSVLKDDGRSLQRRMDFEFFPILGNDRRIQEDGENAAEQLIVDLDPFDAEFVGNVRRRVRVLCRQPSEGGIDKLLHALVDDRHSDSLEVQTERERRNVVDIDLFEYHVSVAHDGSGARSSIRVATL